MHWQQARDRTLVKWRRILESIGSRDNLALIIELNEVCGLCEKACEDAGQAAERCSHCLVFEDSRTCFDTRFAISEALLDGDEGTARAAATAIVARIAAARPPAAAADRPPVPTAGADR